MRNLKKNPKPQILEAEEAQWLVDFQNEPLNDYRRTRYRHAEIKAALIEETKSKCIYCESKVGHNTPGDVEHKVPTSIDRTQHFSWDNLTIACTECNRRKSNYYAQGREFLDPYTDDVESLLVHLGPLVLWRTGEQRAETTVRILELDQVSRTELILRKTAKIRELQTTMERRHSAAEPLLRELIDLQIAEMQDKSAEYSAMVNSILKA